MNLPNNDGLFGAKRVSSLFRAALFLVGLLTGFTAVHAQTSLTPPGDGTASNPYQISQVENLVWLSENVSSSAGQYYQMMNNIDTSGFGVDGLRPIGSFVDESNQQPFLGVFDGNGHSIQNPVINRPGVKFVGLFGFIGLEAQIRNLRLENVSVTGGGRVGGLVGQSFGMVTNCHVSGLVAGGELDRIGGLVGQNWANGVIRDCSSSCTVQGGSNVVGGLVGLSHGIIINSGATGAVTGNDVVGGLVGSGDDGITNCFASGSVTSQGLKGYAGGLVGMFTGTNGISGASNFSISGCHASATVQAQSACVGGLVGVNAGSVTNCHATGTVLGQDNIVGGLVGFNISSIAGCQASGEVSATGDESKGALVGGLVGQNFMSGVIVNSSATGNVTGQYDGVGGLVGSNLGSIADCQAYGSVTGNGTSTAGSCAGGLVGTSEGPITRCKATGPVLGQGEYVGGLVGANFNEISDCQASGRVTGNGNTTMGSRTGGLVGGSEGPIARCKATGLVQGVGAYVGGLVGLNYNAVTDCQAGGDVSATGDATYAACAGGLVGNNTAGGTIVNSSATGNVTGQYDKVGGLVGWNQGSVSGSQASGHVAGIGSPTRGARVGGLAGDNRGPITDCKATGSAQGQGAYVGGLIGLNYNTVSGCHAGGDVSGTGDDTYGSCVGGLIGNNSTGGSIVNSSAWGNVVGQFDNVGGLVGWNRAAISNSTAGGRVTGNGVGTRGSNAGGLVGVNSGSISDSYATGLVQGQGSDVGGLVGVNESTITRCYSAGPVSGIDPVGGLVGSDFGSVDASYWDVETSGQGTSAGSDGSFGKTTAQMKQQATFEGWDFASVWSITETQAYPYLNVMPDFLPGIVSQPEDQAVILGGTATFSVAVSSIAQLGYQWQRNETNIANATNSNYTISGALLTDSGSYRVVVTSSAGAVTSVNAALNVYTTTAGRLKLLSAAPTGFHLSISGVPGFAYVIQTSTNLVKWESLQTNNAPFNFVDTKSSSYPVRFYRVVYLP